MNIPQMTSEQIKARLLTLADELIEAQAGHDVFMDAPQDAKVGDFLKSKGRLELLRAEQDQLAKSLPRATQNELDAAWDAADADAADAREAYAAAKKARLAWMRENGFTKVNDFELSKAVELHDEVKTLRDASVRADDRAAGAGFRAAHHRGEHFPTEKRKR